MNRSDRFDVWFLDKQFTGYDRFSGQLGQCVGVGRPKKKGRATEALKDR